MQVPGQKQIVVLQGTSEAVVISHVSPTALPTRNFTAITMTGENLMRVFSFFCKFEDYEKKSGRFNENDGTLECDTPYVEAAKSIQLEVQLTLYQGKSTFNFHTLFYGKTLQTCGVSLSTLSGICITYFFI